MASPDAACGLSVVGASHRTAPLELRESLALAPAEVRAALDAVRSEGVVKEAVILSTCNRTEFYTRADDAGEAERYVRDLVARIKGRDLLAPGPHLYAFRGHDMVAHLFRVAASLDSLMVGEVQILGQVKDAYRIACEGKSAGGWLGKLLEAALRVGKRVRSETAIGEGAVSVSSSAVDLALKVVGTLEGKRVLVVGAGATGRLVAQHFAGKAPAAMTIANRTPEAAELLARQVGGEAVSLSALAASLEHADVVACATASTELLLTTAMVQEALRRRRNRPLVILDLSVPRNVEAAAGRMENVFLYSVDALQSLVDGNLEKRKGEIPKVEAIVAEETDAYLRSQRARRVTPVIRALREHFEEVRAREVDRLVGDLPEGDRVRVEAVTRAIVNKLLHDPTMALKRAQVQSRQDSATLDAACELFHLEVVDAGEGPGARAILGAAGALA